MSNVLTVVDNSVAGFYESKVIQVALAGSYVAAVPATPVGEQIDLTTLTNPNPSNEGALGLIEPPVLVTLMTGVLPGGYFGVLCPTTTKTLFILKIYTSQGAELTATTYPAALLAATPTESNIYIRADYTTSA